MVAGGGGGERPCQKTPGSTARGWTPLCPVSQMGLHQQPRAWTRAVRPRRGQAAEPPSILHGAAGHHTARDVKWSVTAAATTGSLAGMRGAPETRLTPWTPGHGVPGKHRCGGKANGILAGHSGATGHPGRRRVLGQGLVAHGDRPIMLFFK